MKKPRSANTAEKKRTRGNSNAPASSPSSSTTKKNPSSSGSSDQTTYQVTDYEWLPIGKFTKHVCCDCGLAHKIRYRIKDGSMQEQWTRDEKETDKERAKK